MKTPGHKIAETATKVGHKVGEKVEEATDWAKEKPTKPVTASRKKEGVAQKAEHQSGAPLSRSTGAWGSAADIG